jgi:four helix bundle protein
MRYSRFEELPCWQKARELCQSVGNLIDTTPLGKDFALRDQISRSSGSIMDNIAEGFGNCSAKEFCRFLGYALRSSNEVQSQSYRALDFGYISQESHNEIQTLTNECQAQIKGFRRYLFSIAKK